MPAANPHSDCSAYFVRERMPFGSRLTILIQSSCQPIAPNATSTRPFGGKPGGRHRSYV